MKYKITAITSLIVIVIIVVVLNINSDVASEIPSNTEPKNIYAATSSSLIKQDNPAPSQPSTANVGVSFVEHFDTSYTVAETDPLSTSNSVNWWVSSGGYFYSKEGVGSTVVGSLPETDLWRISFSSSNPLDTDDGYYPQNIFRLVLRSVWENSQQEAYFKIVNNNLSASPNRNSSNGLLFFNRYKDAFNLYYAGIRVDGYAAIKKKINGIYYTLAYEPFDTFTNPYNRDTNPSLLPKQQWIGMRSEIETNPDNTVSIKLYIDETNTGNWVLVVEAIDDGISYGGPIFEEGHAGIRTDFMDVEFDDYRIGNL